MCLRLIVKAVSATWSPKISCESYNKTNISLSFPNLAKPVRFEVMDTSGNRPIIKIRQSPGNRVTHEVNDNDVIKLKTGNDEVVVEIKVTGYVTQVDIIERWENIQTLLK